MTDTLDALRARVDGLDAEDWAGLVAANEAILRLRAGDLLATRGLALALVRLEEFARAEEVVGEALALHGEDEILLRRLENIASARRWAAKQVSSSRGKKSRITHSASTWIKAVHYDGGGWTEEPGAQIWISDPGQRNENGERLYTAAGEPRGRPSWQVGEQVGIYLGGTSRVPMLVEITADAEYNPAFVQAADWAKNDDGERWPWVTWVRVIKSVTVEFAPTLDDLGIASSSMQQRARLLTDPTIHGRLVHALDLAAGSPETP